MITFTVTYTSTTVTLSGDVTADWGVQAIMAAQQAWNVTAPDGMWTAEPKPTP